MLEGHDIICFCNDWDGDPLSKKHIMLRLGQRNRILWVNSIGNRSPRATRGDLRRIAGKLWGFLRGCRQVAPNIYVFSPFVIPFHGRALARWFNRWFLGVSLRWTCRKLGFRDIITWTFFPSSGDVVGTLGERLIVYQCVDEYSEFSDADKHAIASLEQRLLKKADLVIVSSQKLYEWKRPYHPRTFLVTHGVDVAHFQRACHPDTTVPSDIANLPRPVIGFYGLIADWVDVGLFRFLALARPQWSFVLIGRPATDVSQLQGLQNVQLLGRKDYDALPAYCKGFDVALLPFVINDLTNAANPLKLREYLAAGLPVVASAIPEVEKLDGLVSIAKSPDDYLSKIEAVLRSGAAGPRLVRSSAMERESWARKIEEMSDLVTRAEQRLAS
ncbi:MAG TPA: glycosyltransferase [Gemmatimonadales bacterium]|nr:glycosyltransferase [Gemmatimonadales bacterium]